MKPEKYKRFYIEEVFSSALQESDIEDRLNEMLEAWSTQMQTKYPGFEFRILNGETQMMNESSVGGQTLPPVIRFSMHVSYSL